MAIFNRKKNEQLINCSEPHDRVYFKQNPEQICYRARKILTYLQDRIKERGVKLPDDITLDSGNIFRFKDHPDLEICNDYNSSCKIIYKGELVAEFEYHFDCDRDDFSLSDDFREHPERFVDFYTDPEWIGIVCGMLYHRFQGLKILHQYEIKAAPYLHEDEYKDKVEEIYQEALEELRKYLRDVAIPELNVLKVYPYDIVTYFRGTPFQNYAEKEKSLPGD